MAAQTDAMTEAAEPRRRGLRWRPNVSVNSAILALSMAWMAVVMIAAFVPQFVVTEDPTALSPADALQPPGETLLGTDQYGRSILTLLVHGARTALIIGLFSTAVAVVIGGGLGLIAGYVGGWVDMVLGRLVDVLMCFPGVLLALIIAAALGPTTQNLIIAVGVASAPAFARVMRGQVMSVRSRLFIEAARSLGLRPARIVFRHILPNALASTVVLATIYVGVSIVVAASLSFLGLGPRMAVPDWGQLLAAGQPYLRNSWWVSTFPGLVLTITVIAISLLGDWLRDRMDVA